MARRPFSGLRTNIFWNADSWLPDRYQEPFSIIRSFSKSLSKSFLYGPHLRAFGAADKFSDDLVDEYYMYPGLYRFETTKGSAHQRVNLMLVDIVVMASVDQASRLIIIAKLSQDSEMICRVVASLRSRGCRVVLALPELDVHEAQASFGITVCSEPKNVIERIPVWLCPRLFEFDQEPEHHEDEKKHSGSYFIEPPAPDAHTKNFRMREDVDTCVFWDVEDYPLPLGLQLRTFYENIISAVRSRVPSSSGGVSIYAYVAKEEFELFPSHSIPNSSFTTITVVRKAPADKFARLAKMTMDFLLWSMDNPAKLPRPLGNSLLVISKPLEDDILGFRSILFGLQNRGNNVFLALPNDKIPPPEAYVPLLSWEDLSAIGKRKSREDPDSHD